MKKGRFLSEKREAEKKHFCEEITEQKTSIYIILNAVDSVYLKPTELLCRHGTYTLSESY